VSSSDDLRRQLATFVESIESAAKTHPFVDVAAAHRMASALTTALDHWPDLDEAQRSRVQETVAYLVESDDEEHDLLSPIGLVDDEEKVAELLRELGL
jgi:hypothetical protein